MAHALDPWDRLTARWCTTRWPRIDRVASLSEGEDHDRRVVMVRVNVLRDCLQDAQQIGAIGIGGLDDRLVQATGFFSGLSPDLDALVCDLGSGGGLPALPSHSPTPGTRWVLVEAWERRADLLRRSIRRLGIGDRVSGPRRPGRSRRTLR